MSLGKVERSSHRQLPETRVIVARAVSRTHHAPRTATPVYSCARGRRRRYTARAARRYHDAARLKPRGHPNQIRPVPSNERSRRGSVAMGTGEREGPSLEMQSELAQLAARSESPPCPLSVRGVTQPRPDPFPDPARKVDIQRKLTRPSPAFRPQRYTTEGQPRVPSAGGSFPARSHPSRPPSPTATNSTAASESTIPRTTTGRTSPTPTRRARGNGR